ncbi:MAG: DUF4832 domain-containing protein [Candidatus Omnitrophica bacterium]|nr:DUF4832 domain-containing protein [Candidatus Omnitrophota bacterium]MCM8803048.1 DUF4832 domain-containing protein [Candidatus Omnitrophota bacterium]
MKRERLYFREIIGSYSSEEIYKKVRPKEKKDFTLNPHKGFATFQNFNGDPLFGEGNDRDNLPMDAAGPLKFEFKKKKPEFVDGHLPTTIAYCRWFWSVFEPEEGKFNWDMIEKALKVCEIRGQTLQIRLMPFGSKNQPQLPEWYIKKAPLRKSKKTGLYEPDYDEPTYFKYWSRVIENFAEKFANHPNLEIFDIAFIGPWGEGAGEIKEKTVEKFINMYLKFFDKKILLTNIDGYQFIYGTKRGTGWRCDCFGDMRNAGYGVVPNGLGWNHMFDFYPKQIVKARENWKYAPVVLETCHTPLFWYENDMPLEFFDFIIEQGLKYHCSVFMPKYTRIPNLYREKFVKFANQMGYLFVIRQLKFEKRLKEKKKFKYEIWIENIGVAPLYKNKYKFAFKFKQGKKEEIGYSSQDITNWMPGDIWFEEELVLNKNFEDGYIEVYVGIVDKEKNIPKIKFAIENLEKDGWFFMEKVEKNT